MKNKKLPLWTLIGSGIIVMLCWAGFLVSTAVDVFQVTPTPTIDFLSINLTAISAAWQPYTQTAAALPTATVPSATPTETITPRPTSTIIPTRTPLPTYTVTLIPYVPPTLPVIQPPAGGGSSGVCCKICGPNSKPCGDSCISLDKTCHQPPGCACDG